MNGNEGYVTICSFNCYVVLAIIALAIIIWAIKRRREK